MAESIPRRIWKVIYPALLLVVIYLVVYFIAAQIYGIFFKDSYAGLEEFMNDRGSVASIAALVAGGLAGFWLYKKEIVVTSARITKKPVYFLWVAVLGALASHGLGMVVSFINVTGILGTYSQVAAELSAGGLVLTAVKSVILAPLTEELIFRGITFYRGRIYFGFWPAAVVSSVLFAVYHMNLMQGVYAFLYGILLCLVYACFENLWATIAMHAAANLCSLLIQLSGLEYTSYLGAALVCALCLAAGTAIYFLVLKKKD